MRRRLQRDGPPRLRDFDRDFDRVSLPERDCDVLRDLLVADGFVADAAFVDGSHRFHEVFLDLYYLRKIVRPGGLVVLDDSDKPSVRTAAHYYEQDLGWTALPAAFTRGTPGRGATAPTRCRALRLPDPAFEPPFDDFRPF